MTETVAMLDPILKRKLSQAGMKVALTIRQRNELVREAHAAGASLREIADAVGLSHPGVKKIIERG